MRWQQQNRVAQQRRRRKRRRDRTTASMTTTVSEERERERKREREGGREGERGRSCEELSPQDSCTHYHCHMVCESSVGGLGQVQDIWKEKRRKMVEEEEEEEVEEVEKMRRRRRRRRKRRKIKQNCIIYMVTGSEKTTLMAQNKKCIFLRSAKVTSVLSSLQFVSGAYIARSIA